MAPRAAGPTLSHIVGSDSEDEFQRGDADTLLTPDSAIENHKRGPRSRNALTKPSTRTKSKKTAQQEQQPQQRITKAKVATKGTGTITATPSESGPARGRPGRRRRNALAERPNLSDADERDDFDAPMLDDNKDTAASLPPQTQRKRGGSVTAVEESVKLPTKNTASRRGRPARTKDGDGSVAPINSVAQSSKKEKPVGNNRRGRAQAEDDEIVNSPEISYVIPETQQERDLNGLHVVDVDDAMDTRPSHPPIQSTPVMPPVSERRSAVRQRHIPRTASASRRRAGSVSDSERAGDPTLRRRLGDLTSKFENLEIKYNNLKEVGVRDAESNFERLKRSMDERSKAQEALIESLRQELSTQKSLAAETKTLRTRLTSTTSDKTKAEAENKRLSTNLREVQTENKSLAAKLAAARQQASTQRAESAPPRPGSGTKGSATAMRFAGASGIEMGRDSQSYMLKEELYRDLTDLVVLGVKQSEGETIYDCIQTGRNGTLHFHLSTPSSDANMKSSIDYQDAEFDYTPLLDEERDQGLLEILPDFLTEEIQFPRSHAAGFYTKLFENMKRKIEIDGDAD